jgi:hypothetical protein
MLENDNSDIHDDLKSLKDSARRRIREDEDGCIHIKPNGTCEMWSYTRRFYDREQEMDTIIKNGASKQVYRDNVKKNPLICASCPSYTRKTTSQ